jgi:SAM-dependent methyltransferase
MEWYNPTSVLDLGCNVGHWLAEFMDRGVFGLGVDGDNMMNELVIPDFMAFSQDLTKPFKVDRDFGLVLCLEVAEHLDERYANVIVNTCVAHSDLIFWSAASVGQGGYNHVNEQPMEYWIAKFAARGYAHRKLCDVLPPLPHDYYRTNAIEFKRI